MDQFTCKRGGRYGGSDVKWCKEKDVTCLDVDRILKNIDDFANDMITAQMAPWPQHLKALGAQDEAQICPNKTIRTPRKYSVGTYLYELMGGDDQEILDTERAIFIPSKGRYKLPLLNHWPHVPDTSIIVFVPWFELLLYEQWRHDDNMMFLAVRPLPQDRECIGFARHHIFNFARRIELMVYWMIDDSVKVNEICFNNTKVSLVKMLIDVEYKMDAEEQCLLMGINTLNAFQNTSAATLKNDRYMENRRTPTSIVRVYCGTSNNGEYAKNYYHPRLPCREDVVFAASLVKSGKCTVCIDRMYSFSDLAVEIGGVSAFYNA